jgi:hypothetical protein
MLLALYERGLVGALVAAEVSVRELDCLTADDFSDPKARCLFVMAAELDDDAPLEYPTAFSLLCAAVDATPHAAALGGYLHDAYAGLASRETALAYAKLIAAEGTERRERAALAAKIAGRVA